MRQSASIIDTLSEGYRAIHRRPAALLLVFVFNLALLITAPVSFAPLFNRFDSFLTRLAGASTDTNSDTQVQMSALLAELGQTDLRQTLALMNVMPRFVIPRFAPGALATGSVDAVVTIASVPEALLTFVLINLIVFPIGILFLTLVGAAVRGEPVLHRDFWRVLVHIGVAVLGVMAILAAAFVLIGIPFTFAAALLMAVNEVLGILAFSLILVVIIWVQIYVGFCQRSDCHEPGGTAARHSGEFRGSAPQSVGRHRSVAPLLAHHPRNRGDLGNARQFDSGRHRGGAWQRVHWRRSDCGAYGVLP
jgi:hypothetical protein